MMQHLRRRLISVLVALACLAPALAAGTPAASADGCDFVLGFASLHALIPEITGTCTDDEAHNPDSGDAIQHTTNGLLVWRKDDNATAFTNGFWSWVYGPDGLQRRLNTVRFPWEANPDHLRVVPENVGATTAAQGCARAEAATVGTPGYAFVKAACDQLATGQVSVTASPRCSIAIAATAGTPAEPHVRAACSQNQS